LTKYRERFDTTLFRPAGAVLDPAGGLRAEAVTTARRPRFLAEADRIPTESMDYEATLRTVARRAVPYTGRIAPAAVFAA
jgi:hypothetical protein